MIGFRAALVAALVCSLVAPSPVVAQELTTIKVGILTSTTDAPLWFADKLGYFRAEGINVEFLIFVSGENMIAPLGTGQLDVGGGAPAASLYNAVGRGIDVRLVADLGSDPPGYGFQQLIVRSDLVKSGRFKTIRDLKGMRLAINSGGSAAAPQLARLIVKAGLKPTDITRLFIPYSQHEIALKNASIDASLTIEPYTSDTIRNGTAVKIAGNDSFYPYQQLSALIYGNNFVKKNHELGVKFMRAYIKGARYYNDSLLNGKIAGRNADDVIKILASETKLSDAVLRSIVPTGDNPNGRLNVSSLCDDFMYFKAQGLIEGTPTVEQAVDESFVAGALKGLGRYKPAAK